MGIFKRSYWFFLAIVGLLVGSSFACNFSPLTPVPPVRTPTATAPDLTPIATNEATATSPSATASVCVDNAAGRTESCDEYTAQAESVKHYDSSGVAKVPCLGWCQLRAGESLETDSNGQAELNFSDCWPGRLFLFQGSIAQTMVSVCTKADFCPGGNCSNPPAMCVPNGALYADKCAAEFNPVTGSTRIEKNTASYLITYSSDGGDVSTIIVIDGVIRLRPVLEYAPLRLGDVMEMRGGEFTFTMPDETLRAVGGLEPRVVHSVEKLPQVVQELGLEDWVIQAAETASESGTLPENWPAELSGRGVDVLAGGGDLTNPEMQLWLYRAVNWSDLPVSDRRMRLFLGGDPVNALDVDYLPARSAEMLKPVTLRIVLVFPAEITELEKTAAVIAEYLARVGIDTELMPLPAEQLARQVREFEAKQQPYLYLTR